MRKVVVTGGAGFIGTALVYVLVENGYDVHVIDNFSTGSRNNVHSNATYHEYDITRDYAEYQNVFVGAHAVFHLAARISVSYSLAHPNETSDNILGTIQTLCAAKEANVKCVLFVSSAAVYGDQPVPVSENSACEPLSPYGLEKLTGEEYCKLFSRVYNLPTVSVRLFNIYGPRQTNKDGALIPTLLEKTKRGEVVVLFGTGDQLHDFIFVDDAVSAMIQLVFSGASFHGEVFNLGSGTGTPVKDVFNLIAKNIEQKPARLEITDSVADISLITERIAWKPTTGLEEGIRKTQEAYGV
ncbi:MAG: NAD-dependent epimerase/dehydratase family protein [Candidatus Paceibacteria bacterium]